MQNAWFRKSRFKGGKGKKLNIGGGGLGYRERPGLGSENTVSPFYNSALSVTGDWHYTLCPEGKTGWALNVLRLVLSDVGLFSSAWDNLSEFRALSGRKLVFNLLAYLYVNAGS